MDPGRRNLLGVLRWERSPPGAAFARQLEFLVQRHPIVSVTQVLDTYEGGHALPPGSLLLLFGDEAGFREQVWPLLERERLAAILLLRPGRLPSREGARLPSELEQLARAGVLLGLAAARPLLSTETRAVLRAWKRLMPAAPRLLAYGVEVPEPREVEFLRAAGTALAFTNLSGVNDLRAADPLRLRTVPVDPEGSPEALRAQLWARAAPRTGDERRVERARRSARARLQLVHRPLDAVLTASGPSAADPLRRPSNYERLRSLLRFVMRPLPPLERRLRRALLDTRALPLRVSSVELVGHGTAATVFRLGAAAGCVPHVLKTYRWTLGQPRALLLQMARRHQERYRWLCEHFGECLLPTHFLVLHGPLRALPVAACLQEEVQGAHDLLAMPDEELLTFLRARPALASDFAAFARRVVAEHARGFLPDLLGPGNLLHVEHGRQAGLRLIDYGLFDLRFAAPGLPFERAAAATRRFALLLAALES